MKNKLTSRIQPPHHETVFYQSFENPRKRWDRNTRDFLLLLCTLPFSIWWGIFIIQKFLGSGTPSATVQAIFTAVAFGPAVGIIALMLITRPFLKIRG